MPFREQREFGGDRFLSRRCLSVSITRIKVSSHLATPSCGRRGVLTSAFYMAWLAEELTGIKLYYYTVPDGGLGGGVYGEKGLVPCSGATYRVRRTFVLPQYVWKPQVLLTHAQVLLTRARCQLRTEPSYRAEIASYRGKSACKTLTHIDARTSFCNIQDRYENPLIKLLQGGFGRRSGARSHSSFSTARATPGWQKTGAQML